MKAFVQRLAARTVMALAALVILAALLSLLVRVALPQADLVRVQVAEALSGIFGAQVTMVRLDARLRGFAPELTLHDAQLRDRDTGELLLALRELRVDLDLSASLRERGPRIDGVTLVGAELAVVRNSDGAIAVRGLDGLRGDDPGAQAFFLRRGRFSLADSRLDWTDLKAGVPTVHLRVERLDLYNRYKRHLLRIEARPAGETRGDLTLLADLSGSPHRMGEWSGELYLRWLGNDLAQLLSGRLPADIELHSQHVDIESWNQIEHGALQTALARADIGGVEIREPDGQQRIRLGDVRALGRWLPTDAGWQLQLAELALADFALASADLRLDQLHLLPDQTTHGQAIESEDVSTLLRLSGGFDVLPLRLLTRLTALAPDQEAGPLRALRRFDIGGEARDLRYRLYIDPSGDTPLDWSLQGGIDGLRVEQCIADAPAITRSELPGDRCDANTNQGSDRRTRLDHLDLVFEASPGGGFVGLGAQSLSIDPRPALGGMLDLTRLAGDLHWRLDDDGVIDLWTDALIANTPDINTVSRLHVQLYRFGASPLIDLSVRLDNGRTGNYDQIGTYLPVAIIDDGLERWLERAVRAGTLTSGEASYQGRLRDFPNACGSKPFALRLQISGGELDYAPPRSATAANQPEVARDQSSRLQAGNTQLADRQNERVRQAELLGWPPVRDADGVIRFHGRSLSIDVDRGTLRNSRLTAGKAEIADLWNPSTMTLTARGAGPLSDGLWMLKNTPLSGQLSGLADAFDVTGDVALDLTLGIPMKKRTPEAKKRKVAFDGSLQFDGKPSLTATALALPITGVDGRLSFDNLGVRGQDIAAKLDGQPVRIGLETEPADAGAGSTRIEIKGRSSIADLARRLPSPLWSVAQGQADWQAQLSLRNEDMQLPAPPLRILLESELRGVTLSPPAPVGKSAGEARPLRLSTEFTGSLPMQLTLSVGDIDALLLLELEPGAVSAALTRAAITVGEVQPALPATRGILINGQLETLDLSRWVDWSRDADTLFGREPPKTADTGPDRTTALDPEQAPRVLPSQLNVGELSFGALQLRDVNARFSRRPDGWSIGFAADDNGGGVDLPPAGSDGTLRIRLDQLDLQSLTEQDKTKRQPDAQADPRGIGRLALSVESLRYGDDVLGRLLLATEPISGGIRFSEVSLTGPLLRATGSGQWTIDATDYAQTELRIDAQSDDLGQLLNALDYYSDVQGAPAEAQLTLSWPGGPARFSLARARGSLQMEVGAGRLLAVDPGVGRMLGLVNLSALTRRLTLDFTDVTDPGFGFDSISGNASIGGGLARLSQLELLSSTADIRITGVTNLIERTFDQKVQVTPKVGSGVAIAGAVAGGPLVGAACCWRTRSPGAPWTASVGRSIR